MISIRPLLAKLVSPDQKAFQAGKLIVENTQLVQDYIAWADELMEGGFLLFCDQDNAYPRVQWDFMHQVMRSMGIHEDFRRMVEILYENSEYKVKVNSHIGGAFRPTNGVSQGGPLSPILYLLVIQSFLSLISTTDTLQGVKIPGTGGDDQLRHTLKVLGFADDLIIFLRNTGQLNEFKRLLNIYEDGSGALNSWSKTLGMRVGSLRDTTCRRGGRRGATSTQRARSSGISASSSAPQRG